MPRSAPLRASGRSREMAAMLSNAKHYANEIFKVSGNKKAKLTALEQMVARMRREIEEEVRLELE